MGWAGGPLDTSSSHTMYVKSVSIEDYGCGGDYSYSDLTGSYQSIKSTGTCDGKADEDTTSSTKPGGVLIETSSGASSKTVSGTASGTAASATTSATGTGSAATTLSTATPASSTGTGTAASATTSSPATITANAASSMKPKHKYGVLDMGVMALGLGLGYLVM